MNWMDHLSTWIDLKDTMLNGQRDAEWHILYDTNEVKM